MANRYWVGGTGTWNTTSTTNWSATSGGTAGASVPTAADSVFFDQATTYTVTMTGALLCLDFTVSAGTVTFATGTTPTLAISGSWTIVAATVWNSTGLITLNAGSATRTITTNGVTINAPVTISGNGSAIFNLGSALTLGSTQTFTIDRTQTGSFNLNGFDVTTGVINFDSGVTTRTINFGSNNIYLVHPTAGTAVLIATTLTSFVWSGTGGFIADASVTRTYRLGNVQGGSSTVAPNLAITSGAAIPSIATGSWINNLDFTGSSTTPAAAIVNVNSINLSTGGTYTNLSINAVGTGTITTNGKSVAALTVNTPGTVTLAGALGVTTYTQTTGAFNFATNNLTCSGAASYTAGTLSNIGTITCTTWTVTGAFTFGQGTITPSTSFVLTSGSFTYNVGATLSPVPTFTHTAGTVTLNQAYALTATGTYTLTAGTLTLGGNLTTGIFSSAVAGVRAIAFSTNNIILAHTTAAQTVLNMAVATTFTYTGTGGFVSDASVTRTYTFGTTGGTSAIAPNLSITSGAAVPTFTTGSWFNTLDFTGSGTTPAASVVNVNAINLSIGGTYTSLGVTMVGTGTLTNNGKAIAAFTVNNGAGTATLSAALSCTTYTQTAGTINFATFNLTCSAGASYAAGTLNNIGTISCTTWAETGTFALSSGTISASTSFTVTSGAFTYNVGGTISTPAFVHTAGTVTLNQALTLSSSYTLTAGTLTLGANLTASSFITTGTGVRAIAFSTNQIILTGNNATIWDGGGINITYTGTPTIVSTYTGSTGTRTINVGTGWTEATAFDVKAASAVGISIGTSGTDTVAVAGNIKTFDLTGMLFTFSQGVMSVYVDYIIPATGGTIASSANTLTLASTNATPRNITTNGRTLDFPIAPNGVGGTFQLTTALVQGSTQTLNLINGTINLNGFNWTTGIFSSSTGAARGVTFGSNFIYLVYTTAGTNVLLMANGQNFAPTGSGGFSTAMTVTRSFSFGSTLGGTTTSAPNLFITSGASVPTFTTASWFNNVDFTGSSTTPAATVLNITGSLTLSTGGTYTSLGITMVNTGTITPTGKTIAAFTVNTPGTVTLAGPLGCSTYTQTAGTINFATFNLTCSAGASYAVGTLNNIGTISCTTWAETGTFTLSQGTISASTSYTVTSGSFTYSGGTITTPSFVHTAGTVTLTQPLTLTGSYTLTAGTVTITNLVLTCTGFLSTGTGVRSIVFGTTGQITLTGNAITIWDGGGINITYTGTPTIVSNYTGSTGTRTINVGTGWTEATAFDVKVGSAVGISIGTSGTDIVAIAGNLDTLDLTGMLFTYSPGVMTVYVDYTIPSTGGTVSASANTTTFASTNATPRVITVSRSIDFPITFSGVGGTFNLGDNFTIGATRTTTLTSGVLALNGYNYSTGLFSSAGSLARTISFGSNSITVSGSGTVWTTATIVNLSISGTPVVNVTNASATATTVLSGALPESQSISYNFTAGSYALTFLGTAGYTAKSVNFTGFVGTLGATAACTVYGNYTLSSGMTVTASANVLTFGATSGTNIITTSGKTVPPIAINGLGGTFNISGSLTTSGLFQVLAGTFSTTVSNHNITCTQFDSSTNTSARSISLNGSTVTISGTAGITLDSTNLTFNAGTSQITLTNATSTVISSVGGGTFYNVSCTGGGTVALSTVNTYNNLTLTNGPSVPSVVTVSDTQTINGVFASVSTNATTRLTLQSITDGVQETISAGSVSLSDIDFQDIYAAGATIPWTGTRLGNLGDNTNITFGTSNTRYWSLATGGNWNAIAWATTSGGTPDVNNFPLPQDTCIIQNTGLNTSATITINANWNIGSINMSGRTTAMTLAIGVTTPFIYGSWINGSGYTITGTGTVNFVGQDAVQTITGLAITFTPNIAVNTIAQTVQLGSALTMGATSTFTLTSGVLSLNGYNLTTGIFSSNNTNTRTILFGSNNIILSHTTAATTVLSMANATGFNYTGTGGFTSPMSVTRTFTCATTTAVSGSVLFNSTNQLLGLPTSSAFDLSSGTWTFEFWMYSTATPTVNNACRIFLINQNGNQYALAIQYVNDGSISVGVPFGGKIGVNTKAGAVTLNTWYHVAIVSNAGSASIFINGTQSGSTVVISQPLSFQVPMSIGYDTAGTVSFQYQGYLSNIRIVKGVAVYTGTFTVPTSPLQTTQPAGTNISAITGTQTSLLLNTPNNGSFLVDSSTNNFNVTNTGSVTANALTPITVFPSAGVPPNLAINSGASIPTISSGSTFNILDFTGSTCIPAATSVNLNSNLVLASGGTYTALSVSMNGAGTNTITGNSKTIAALTFTAGTNSIVDTLTCTTFTINGANFNFASGTLTPTTSFTLTSGSFTYGGTATLSAVPTFTQTAGTVTFSKVYALTATGTYTLTSGTLTLNGFDLTTGIFSSNNTNTRTILFGSNNIILSHTTAATTVLSMANTTGFNYTGTGGFTSPMSVTRTFISGTTPAVSGSISFTASSNQYLTPAASTALQFGTGDFTIEAWINPGTQTSTWGSFLGSWQQLQSPGDHGIRFSYSRLSANCFEFFYKQQQFTEFTIISSNAFPINAWYHVAIVRIGTTFTLYVNGVSNGSYTFAGTGIQETQFWIGVENPSYNQSWFNGLISNVRFVKGIGVYTGNFTPPSSPLTVTQPPGTNISAITGTQTSLLLNTPNNAYFLTDSSTNNLTVTNTNGAVSSASTPITVIPSAGGVPPNLAINSGASIPTITSNSTFNILDFTGSTCVPAAAVVNVVNGLTLASGGTYTSLSVTSIGPTSIITNAKTIAALLINYNGNPTLTGSLGCTTLTVSGGYFDLSNTVTLTPSSTITITSGTFIYGGTATLASVATFTQTAGAVTLKAYSLTATGTYTFTSGTLTLTGNLTTGIFSSNNSNNRTIFFDIYNIILSTTTAALTNLDMASTTGFLFTGTGGFTSPMSVTRTFNVGTINSISGSLLFNGSSSYLQYSSNLGPFSIGTGNFTFEAWINMNYLPGAQAIWSMQGSSIGYYFFGTSGSEVYLQWENATSISSSGAGITTGVWYHVAAVRQSGVVTFYVNGVSKGGGSFSYSFGVGYTRVGAGGATIVGDPPTWNFFNGYISNFRFVNGLVVYTGNFTPSSSPLTATQTASTNISAITGTQTAILLNTPNNVSYLIDSGANNYNPPSVITAVTAAASTPITTFPAGGVPPNLAINSGASIPSIVSGSTLNILDFTGSTCTPATAIVNLNSNLLLASGGTYTALSFTFKGTATISTNSKTIAALAINASSSTITQSGALSCTTFTLTDGTMDFSTNNLTCSGAVSYSGGSLINLGTLTCTTFTITGPNYTFSSGTITPSTSFTLTSGNFTYNSPAVLSAVPTFTQSAGNVSLNQAYSLSATGTYTLNSGTLSLGGTLTTGIFSSSNTNLRSISFGTNNIVLSHTTAAQTVLNMANESNFSYTGTGGFTSPMSVTRTFTSGTIGAVSGSLLYTGGQKLSLAASSAFDLSGGTWTIEFWMNSTATPTVGNTCRIFMFGTNSTNTGYDIAYNSNGSLFAGVPLNSITGISTAAGVISLNTWYHVAIVSNAGSAYIYVNGFALAGPVTITQPTTSSPTLAIGYDTALTVDFQYQGYLSNIRITKGVAVYTGAFTPPVSPLNATQSAGTNISAITGTQTSLLLNTPNNAYFLTDNSTNNFTVTNNGSITAVALTPITVLPAAGQAPNLALTSGASVPTLTTGSAFNILDFTGSSTTPATTSLNIASALTLSSGGTYTGLTISSTGATTITGNNKTIAALSLNNGSSATTVDTTGLAVTGAVTMPQGSLSLNGNLSSSSLTCSGSSRTITGTNTTYSITGSGTSAWNYSPTGSAVFNGTTQYLSLPTNAALQFGGDFTVEMWIYPTALSGFKGLFGQRSSEVNYSPIIIELSAATLTFFVSTSGSAWAVSLTSPSITVNTWTHIALVRSGTTVSYYINGVAGGTTGTATGALMTPVAPTYIGIDSGTPSGAGYFPGYISNLRIVKGVAVYTGNFTVPTGPLNATQTANPYGGSNTSAITGTQTSLLLNTRNYYDYTTDSSTNNFTVTNNNGVTYNVSSPTFTTGTPGFTCSGFTINMTSASAKTFVGGIGTYPALNQGGAGILSITGTNTFDNITNTVNGVTVTFPTSTTTTFNNFSLSGIAGSLVTINSSTTSTAATITKSSGIVYGSYLSIRDSTATGGATWYAGPTSTNTSNNTGWIFNQLPIINMGNISINGGVTFSNDPI